MSLPHMLTHPLGLPRGRTSRRGERARQQLALLFLRVRGARPAQRFVPRGGILVQKRPLAMGRRATVIHEHLGRKHRQGNESTDKGIGEPLVMCCSTAVDYCRQKRGSEQ